MDESHSLGDAEMRFVTVNGQTIMLEGDLENMAMTNEMLNEMFMENTGKEEDQCMDVDDNTRVNGTKNEEEEPTKIEITIQGENNELQTIQIGMEEAKAFGLYISGIKSEDDSAWEEPCILSNDTMESQEQISVVGVNTNRINVNGEMEGNRSKLESMPLLDTDCSDKEQNILLSDNVNKNSTTSNSNGFQFNDCNDTFTCDISKPDVALQEENSSDNLPAIGHLEGFQIPTAEDGTLLPATVNAKMADGSYQMLTLIPQIVDGNVTYTVQFANFDSDDSDAKNLGDSVQLNQCYSEPLCNGVENKAKDSKSKANAVQEFLNSVHAKRDNKPKDGLTDSIQQLPVNMQNNASKIILNENILDNSNNFAVSGNVHFDNLSVPYTNLKQAQTPIETKINNLISENESVIAKCKKVKYGKKPKESIIAQPSDILERVNSMTKSNVGTKKAQCKNRNPGKSNEDGVEAKKLKLSLLKPNNEQVNSIKTNENASDNRNSSSLSTNNHTVPHVNLNCRLEFPNLKALDDPSQNLSYLKIKSQTSSKQPYFNVLPYPKDKTVSAQRQILPINCDLQQAKSLISLQKFLESQKLQLKIQPITSNGTKMINIRPKPSLNEQTKVVQDSNANLSNLNQEKGITNNTILYPTQASHSGNQNYQDCNEKMQSTNVKDVLLNDGKINFMKFLKPVNNETNDVLEKESSSEYCSKNGIFIKNDPEYFNCKDKDGKMDEHPLGSTENPIRLVQNGHTFHR